MKRKQPSMKIIGLIIGCAILLSACGAPQQTPVPIPAPINPLARGYVSLAYDMKSDRVILFGGQTGDYTEAASYNGETWAYDPANNQWTQINPSVSPGGRTAAELVYDSESGQIIMFGGCGNPSFSSWGKGDTWSYNYNANTWTEMAKGPSRHVGPRLAYDSESDRVILFGGYDMNDFFYNDTWAYDFNTDTWTEMKPQSSPPGRNFQAMTYDSKADRVLVWGGLNTFGTPVDESVWAYDYNANSWQEIKHGEPYPRGRDYPVMVYDQAADRTILFGGSIGGDETWGYDYNSNTWTKLEPATAPGETSRHAMVYAVVANRVILFGGQAGSEMFDFRNETWAYDSDKVTWTNVTAQP